MSTAHGEPDPASVTPPGIVVPFTVFTEYRNRRRQPAMSRDPDTIAPPIEELTNHAPAHPPAGTIRQGPTTERMSW